MPVLCETIGPVRPGPPCLRPLYASAVAAGFPSPADDYIETPLDLNDHLIDHPAATFFVRVTGESMIDAGIHDGDLLIVDRALDPVHGNIVIAVIFGEMTVKRLARRDGRVFLEAANRDYAPTEITHEMDLHIWGVCRHVVHALR